MRGKGYLLGGFAGELGIDPKAVWIRGEGTKYWIGRVLLYPKWITTRKETDWKQVERVSIILEFEKALLSRNHKFGEIWLGQIFWSCKSSSRVTSTQG